MRRHLVVTVLGLALLLPAAAQAGRGSSPAAIKSAINSGSVDAIQSELERAEHLLCASCVDLVLPLIDNDDVRIRQVAAWWLARRGIRRTVSAQMITRLTQPDSIKARNAADVLGELRQSSFIPVLGIALTNTTLDADARAHVARALGTIGDPAAQ